MKMDWRLTVRVISAFVFALALGVLSWLLYQSWENRQLNRELQSHRPGETADIGTDGILNSFRDLLSQNSDTIGWLTIDGTTIDYVVMHAPDEPDKYLHRDFYGNESRYGTLFVAEECDVQTSDNIIIYGHHMRDGSMFAKLKDYRDPEIYKSCPYFWIFTPQKDLLYRICSIHPEGVGGSSFIIRFGSGKELEEWRQKVREQSEVETGWEPNPEDRIVTLSTCTEDRGTRYTVQGVLVYKENQGGQRGDG